MLVKDELIEVAYAVAGDRIEAAIYTPSKVGARQGRGRPEERSREPPSRRKYPEATNFEI